MSVGTRLGFGLAYELAEQASARLAPTLEQLKAVGSLRRRRRDIGDIEFLARPYFDRDLTGEITEPVLDPVRRALRELGTWVKGGDRMMQITDLLGCEGAKLDLYLVHPPAMWGSLLAIRTGPRDLGVYCVDRMRSRGYLHRDGCVRRIGTGEVVPTATEEAFFDLAGVECMPPARRDAQARRLWQERRG